MEETLFTRIKRAVENEKQKMTRGEAKIESLSAEKIRLLNDAVETSGRAIENKEILGEFLQEQKEDITRMITEAEEILRKEGVDY